MARRSEGIVADEAGVRHPQADRGRLRNAHGTAIATA